MRGDHRFEATVGNFEARSAICPIEPTSETSEYHAEPREAPSVQSYPVAGWGVFRNPRTIHAENRLSQIEADPRFEGTVGGFEARSIDPGGRGRNPGGLTAKCPSMLGVQHPDIRRARGNLVRGDQRF